jgi:hypothetical protein
MLPEKSDFTCLGEILLEEFLLLLNKGSDLWPPQF